MQRKQLTGNLIAALAAKRKRYIVYDSTIRSLGVRISPKGKKTFIVVGRFNGNKHPTRRRLGVVGKLTVEQARERALKFDARPSDKFATVASSTLSTSSDSDAPRKSSAAFVANCCLDGRARR
jgi:hypothetical protein